jgi:hypothetical protein
MKKKGFEFSFAWLFAIIAGAAILFLAIYGTSRFIRTSKYHLDTITAKQLSIIFDPLEVGLASGKSNIAKLKEETRIFNDCSSEGYFGKHHISLSIKLGVGRWQEPGGKIAVPNKYIFSQDIEEGKTIYFFSKPLEMPWKVSEIIFLTTEQYCFVNAPDFVQDEVVGLNLRNIKIENCSAGDVRVCFGKERCDIRVEGSCFGECESEYDYGFVTKGEERLFYVDGLLYAGIFSSREIYECNVKRLMKRLVQQALLYKDEASFLADKCASLPFVGLLQMANAAKTLEKPEDLLLVRQIAEQVDKQNEAAECDLW